MEVEMDPVTLDAERSVVSIIDEDDTTSPYPVAAAHSSLLHTGHLEERAMIGRRRRLAETMRLAKGADR
jgi:hypothetical protein